MLPAEVPTAIKAALPEGLNGWGCTEMTPLVIPFLLLSTALQQATEYGWTLHVSKQTLDCLAYNLSGIITMTDIPDCIAAC